MSDPRELCREIREKLNVMQTEYDARVLAASTLVFAADLYGILLAAKLIGPSIVADSFAQAQLSAFDSRDREQPKIIYGDGQSGGLQ